MENPTITPLSPLDAPLHAQDNCFKFQQINVRRRGPFDFKAMLPDPPRGTNRLSRKTPRIKNVTANNSNVTAREISSSQKELVQFCDCQARLSLCNVLASIQQLPFKRGLKPEGGSIPGGHSHACGQMMVMHSWNPSTTKGNSNHNEGVDAKSIPHKRALLEFKAFLISLYLTSGPSQLAVTETVTHQ